MYNNGVSRIAERHIEIDPVVSKRQKWGARLQFPGPSLFDGLCCPPTSVSCSILNQTPTNAMKSLLTILMAIIAVSMAGCVQTQATMLSSKKFTPLTPEEVTIYLSEEDIPSEYEKVAILNASGSTSYTSESQMYNALKKQAAKIGCNGILFQEIKEPSQGAKIVGALFGVGTERKAEMIAIYVHH